MFKRLSITISKKTNQYQCVQNKNKYCIQQSARSITRPILVNQPAKRAFSTSPPDPRKNGFMYEMIPIVMLTIVALDELFYP
jgi:hypothetical protein